MLFFNNVYEQELFLLVILFCPVGEFLYCFCILAYVSEYDLH